MTYFKEIKHNFCFIISLEKILVHHLYCNKDVIPCILLNFNYIENNIYVIIPTAHISTMLVYAPLLFISGERYINVPTISF